MKRWFIAFFAFSLATPLFSQYFYTYRGVDFQAGRLFDDQGLTENLNLGFGIKGKVNLGLSSVRRTLEQEPIKAQGFAPYLFFTPFRKSKISTFVHLSYLNLDYSSSNDIDIIKGGQKKYIGQFGAAFNLFYKRKIYMKLVSSVGFSWINLDYTKNNKEFKNKYNTFDLYASMPIILNLTSKLFFGITPELRNSRNTSTESSRFSIGGQFVLGYRIYKSTSNSPSVSKPADPEAPINTTPNGKGPVRQEDADGPKK